MGQVGWVILVFVNVPLYWGLWKLIFGTWDDFCECLRFWATPDLVSACRGEYGRDWWGELKLGMWIGLSVVCVLGEGYLLGKLIG
jgi:hypothetical protein